MDCPVTIEQLARKLRKGIDLLEKGREREDNSLPASSADNFVDEHLLTLKELLSRLYELGLEDTSRPSHAPPDADGEDQS